MILFMLVGGHIGHTPLLNMAVSRGQSPTFTGSAWVTYPGARANPVSVARVQEALSGKPGLGAVQMEAWLSLPELGQSGSVGVAAIPTEPLARYTSIFSEWWCFYGWC